MDMRPWLLRTTSDSVTAVAKKIGMTQSTLDRQLKGEVPAETIAKIARAYDVSVIAALVEHGTLAQSDLDDTTALLAGLQSASVEAALQDASEAQILAEIGRRLERGRVAAAEASKSRARIEKDVLRQQREARSTKRKEREAAAQASYEASMRDVGSLRDILYGEAAAHPVEGRIDEGYEQPGYDDPA